MSAICSNVVAAMNFERFAVAVNGEEQEARISWHSVFRKAKVSSPEFRLAGQFNRMPTNRAFSIAAAPSAIAESLNGLPKRKHRPTMPRVACLANLVKVSRKLSDYSGRIVRFANRINPTHSHLALHTG